MVGQSQVVHIVGLRAAMGGLALVVVASMAGCPAAPASREGPKAPSPTRADRDAGESATRAARTAIKIGVVDERSCALLIDGTVSCWGLLTPWSSETEARDEAQPVPVGPMAAGEPTLDDVADLAIGYDHSCLVRRSGGVRCWGSNEFGELGDGTHVDALAPTADPQLSNVAQVAVGSDFSCARFVSGGVSCWGRNYRGELATGGDADSAVPVRVPELDGVVSLALSGDRGLALRDEGRLSSWGWTGSASTPLTPMPPMLPEGASADAPALRAVEIVASPTHSCARLADGSVRCWGRNEHGQLGDGSEVYRETPTLVRGISHVVQIAVGRGTSCARLADGSVRCWGSNASGQLGDGTLVDRATPTLVSGLSHCKQIAIAFSHACALMEDGSVQCWGSNASGELGDRTHKARAVRGPVLW